VRFTSTVRIMPPRGAATLMTTVANRRSQGIMAAARVRAYDTIANDRLVPESIPEILAMDENFPGEVRQLGEQYLQRHGGDARVMSHLLDAYRRFGEIGKMGALARKAIATKGPQLEKLHTKARHALAQVRELDTNWLPTAGLAATVTNPPAEG